MKPGRLKTVRDNQTGTFLLVFFGILNIVILMLVWMRPTPEAERILATFVGSGGLLVVSVKALMLKSLRAGKDTEQVPVEVNKS